MSPASDGRDDDFHEQSANGSVHGGSFAPALSPLSGLPVAATIGTLTMDGTSSPALDRGDAADAVTERGPRPTGSS